MKVSYFSRFLVIALAAVFCLPPAAAQSGRGTITGIVKDSSGAVVPGAEILIVEANTGVETKARTTDTGVYRAPYVPAGKYRISASLRGFKTAVRDNIDLLLTQTLTVDFELQAGEITEQITVSAEAPLLESSTPEIGVNINEKSFTPGQFWLAMALGSCRTLSSGLYRVRRGVHSKEPSMADRLTATKF